MPRSWLWLVCLSWLNPSTRPSAATIADLEKQGIDYILGARERSSTKIRDVVLEDDGTTVPLIIPRQKGETDLAIKEVNVDGRRTIVCRNPEVARKDAETRAALLAGLEQKLKQGDKALVGNKGGIAGSRARQRVRA